MATFCVRFDKNLINPLSPHLVPINLLSTKILGVIVYSILFKLFFNLEVRASSWQPTDREREKESGVCPTNKFKFRKEK
jgi:hypothetical protein